ncbi:MAG TPA: GGDEF domain-containing protein [Paucimonas sp.]|nr:GGDEF domain-containing protein [Paucimonas sp.]
MEATKASSLAAPTTFGAAGHALDKLQLFEGVNHASVATLLADCPILRLEAGQPVADGGNSGSRLYVVLRGALGGTTADMHDKTVTKVLPGECIGELSALDDHASPISVIALQDSEVLAIDSDKLWRLIDESNGVARNLLRMLAFRIRAANAQIRKRQKLGEFYRQLSMVDGLTGLQNRSWLNEQLPLLIGNAHAVDNPLALIMIDIDHFKRFNDEHGHLAGDDALRTAAKVLLDQLRPRDFAVRYGGEEMMVILPNTNQKGAMIVAQRLCERMRESVVFGDMRKPLPHITASFGVASLTEGQQADDLIAAADRALYQAKEAGRDRVAAV